MCRHPGPAQEVTFMVHDERPAGPSDVEVRFDDERAVSDAGVVLVCDAR